jgi:predicted P-loop ATPase/GTPase
MSNSPIASTSYRPARRSTRLNEAISMRVEGVDSYRGPYSEEVSTVSVSAHGCKYHSKHQVLSNALVILEMKGEKPNTKPVSARGRVKWVTGLQGGLFETAVELEDPGNVWGIAAPPKDWLPFCGPRTIEIDTAKSKPFAVPRPEPAAPAVKETTPAASEHRPSVANSSDAVARQSLASMARPMGQLMGDFQQQMETMLAEVATAAVREKTIVLLDDVHNKLRQEAKAVLAEATASQAAPWIEQALKQMKIAGQDTAQKLHAQWMKKVEADLNGTFQQIEARRREVEDVSRSLAASSLQKVESVLETSRRDGVDRIVARLKEQVTPVVEEARKAAAELTRRKEELDKIIGQSVEQTTSLIEQACAKFDKQFETMIRARIDAARAEIERTGMAATDLTLNNLRISSQQHQDQAKAQLRGELNRVSESMLREVEEKAAEASQQFANEMKKQSRSHLEFVSGAISELAKGIGKLSKD